MRSSELPSLKVPVAVSSTVLRRAIEGFGGVTVSEVSVAPVTVTVVEAWMPSRVALIEVLPTLRAVTNPWVPCASLTCAIALLSEVQLT